MIDMIADIDFWPKRDIQSSWGNKDGSPENTEFESDILPF
jgi:hypothetical protein